MLPPKREVQSAPHPLGPHVYGFPENEIGVKPCGCGDEKCKVVRVFIANPQLDDEGFYYCNLPPEVIPELVDSIRNFSRTRST